MPLAAKVLIVGGVLNLAYGMLLGFAIVMTRSKGAPETPRYLNTAHVGAMLQAAVLLGLVWAIQLSTLDSGWETLAAWLLVIASALIAVMDTANWLNGVRDAFAEKAKTVALGAAAGAADTVAGVILVVGVFNGL
jgi:hypothetical protein